MAFGKPRRRTERSKVDATPPWGAREAPEHEATTGPYDIRDAPAADVAGGLDADSIDADAHEGAEPGTEGAGADGEDADAAAAAGRGRVDFGALQVPIDSGLDLRVEVTAEGAPSAVTLANSSGTMQLGVFAAPRTEGIWDEVRGEIRLSIAQQGGTAEDVDGPFGTELIGRLPQSNGSTPVRFLGVDGPRWFLRAMLAGPAAADRAAAAPFIRAFRRLVVVRGDAPLPVREAVPLTLPKDLAQQIESGAAAAPAPRTGNRGPAAPRTRRR